VMCYVFVPTCIQCHVKVPLYVKNLACVLVILVVIMLKVLNKFKALCSVWQLCPVNCSLLMLQTIDVCIEHCWYCTYCISLCLSFCFLLSMRGINLCISI